MLPLTPFARPAAWLSLIGVRTFRVHVVEVAVPGKTNCLELVVSITQHAKVSERLVDQASCGDR
jgi:hypothetical protein